MASIRELKKDINFLASTVVSECYFKQLLHAKGNEDKTIKVLTSAVDFRNEYVNRANHPDGKENPKLVKAYFSSLRKEMVERFSGLIDDLAAIK